MEIVFVGLSITSSWGNGHATTYRGLIRELSRLGHRVTFLERDVPWYAEHRDLPNPDYCSARLYGSLEELQDRHASLVRSADAVIVGSYVPNGIEVGQWVIGTASGVTGYYDIDTPVTLARLKRGECEYLSPDLISKFDIFLSFTGGPILRRIEEEYKARRALPLYCLYDPELYYPEYTEKNYDLGYMGTFSEDRQPTLDALLVKPAASWKEGRFIVAGPQYPSTVDWPENVKRIDHLDPSAHRSFYNSQRFTLNVTRRDMIAAGYSPSVRLFEAAACGTPIITDYWTGLESFFEIGKEILIGRGSEQILEILRELPESARREIGEKARARVAEEHSASRRANELESYLILATKELSMVNQ